MNIRARLIKNSMLLLFPIMLGACSIGKIDGTYHRKFETLELKPDSSYFYKYRMEWPKAISMGHWQIIGRKKIIISSTYDMDRLPLYVTEALDSNEHGNYLEVIPGLKADSAIKAGFFYELMLNGKSYSKNKTGIFIFKDLIETLQIIVHIDTNTIAFPTRHYLISEVYKKENKTTNRIILKLPVRAEFFYYDHFVTDTLDIRKKGILWHSKGLKMYKRS